MFTKCVVLIKNEKKRYAEKPSDIDIVYIFGYGFPPVKGGPMFWADNYVGLDKVLARLRVYDEEARKRYTTTIWTKGPWRPCPEVLPVALSQRAVSCLAFLIPTNLNSSGFIVCRF